LGRKKKTHRPDLAAILSGLSDSIGSIAKAQRANLAQLLFRMGPQQLEDHLQQTLRCIIPSITLAGRKARLFKELQRLVNEALEVIVQRYQVPIETILVGSSSTGLDLESSDIDVVVLCHHPAARDIQWLITSLEQHIIRTRPEVQTAAIRSARVPILKLAFPAESSDGEVIDVDISFNEPSSIASCQMIRTHCESLPSLQPLARLIKHWCKVRQLPDATCWGMGAYCWVLLAIFSAHTQQTQCAKQRLGQTEAQYPLTCHLRHFFRLFAVEFNFRFAAVCFAPRLEARYKTDYGFSPQQSLINSPTPHHSH
jgi:DNA polymerase sigma